MRITINCYMWGFLYYNIVFSHLSYQDSYKNLHCFSNDYIGEHSYYVLHKSSIAVFLSCICTSILPVKQFYPQCEHLK